MKICVTAVFNKGRWMTTWFWKSFLFGLLRVFRDHYQLVCASFLSVFERRGWGWGGAGEGYIIGYDSLTPGHRLSFYLGLKVWNTGSRVLYTSLKLQPTRDNVIFCVPRNLVNREEEVYWMLIIGVGRGGARVGGGGGGQPPQIIWEGGGLTYPFAPK